MHTITKLLHRIGTASGHPLGPSPPCFGHWGKAKDTPTTALTASGNKQRHLARGDMYSKKAKLDSAQVATHWRWPRLQVEVKLCAILPCWHVGCKLRRSSRSDLPCPSGYQTRAIDMLSKGQGCQCRLCCRRSIQAFAMPPCLLDAWEGLQSQQIGLGSLVLSGPSGIFTYRAHVASSAPENDQFVLNIDCSRCLALDLRSMVFLPSSTTSGRQRDVPFGWRAKGARLTECKAAWVELSPSSPRTTRTNSLHTYARAGQTQISRKISVVCFAGILAQRLGNQRRTALLVVFNGPRNSRPTFFAENLA